MRKIVLLGAPGAGKGTQCLRLSQKYEIPHISTGDIFRYNIKNGTEIGLVAKSYIDNGQLVPDEVTIEIVRQRLAMDDCKTGYLLDGFPRNLKQAEALDSFETLDIVLNIDVSVANLLHRITGRRLCSVCGHSYHIDNLNGSTKCLACGGDLVKRDDDNEETVSARLSVYDEQTKPLIEYYSKKGLLINIDGNRDREEIFAEEVKILG